MISVILNMTYLRYILQIYTINVFFVQDWFHQLITNSSKKPYSNSYFALESEADSKSSEYFTQNICTNRGRQQSAYWESQSINKAKNI